MDKFWDWLTAQLNGYESMKVVSTGKRSLDVMATVVYRPRKNA